MNAPSEKSEAQLNNDLVVALSVLRRISLETIDAARAVARGADYVGDGTCVLSESSMDLHTAIGRVLEAERALARFYSGE